MKNYICILISISTLMLLNACDLQEDKEDMFSCEKNAPIQVNGTDQCAFAVGEKYLLSLPDSTEKITIRFSYGGGSFKTTIQSMEIEEGRTYINPGELDFYFPEINKSGSGTLSVTRFDRVVRKISGHFDLTAEGASNYTPYTYHVTGNFNNVYF